MIYQRVVEMAANVVPAYVIGRRRVIAMEMQEAGNLYVVKESGGIH